jgi:hypothetical protein
VDEHRTRVEVLLDIGDNEEMIEDLEELESARAYDLAKSSGDEAIPFEEVVEEIERRE